MEVRRVAVTGMGVVSPVGTGVDKFWTSIKAGVSGSKPIERLTGERIRFGCEADDFIATDFMPRKVAKRNGRFILFGLAASQMALEQSGYDIKDPFRTGVYVGTNGGYDSIEKEFDAYLNRGPRGVSPFAVTNSINNMVAGNISIRWGLKGPSVAPAAACAAGLYGISDAWNAIRYGQIDAAIAGGSDSTMTGFVYSGYENNRTLSSRHDDPEHASRPFDKNRDGFVMGEGAGILILESMESAIERGANILAEIVACHTSSDASHITAPDQSGDTIARTIQDTLNIAGIAPSDVSYVSAHGTSTAINDMVESKAIRKVFNSNGYQVPVTALKSMIGHSLGASGAIALVASIKSTHDNIIPPTINTTEIDEACAPLDVVMGSAREAPVDHVLINAFGFGGHNGCVLIKKAE